MDAFEPIRAGELRVAVLLPAGYTLAWQDEALEQLGSLAGACVDVLRPEAPPVADVRWRKLAARVPALRSRAAAPAPAPAPAAGDRWDLAIDLAGTPRAAWPVNVAHGVWQLLDAQGTHLARAWPSHAAISAGLGGELHLVRDGRILLDSLRFFADPHYPRSLERLYALAPLLLRRCLHEFARAGLRGAPFAPRPAQAGWRRALAALRGTALAGRRRLAAQWLSESWMIGVIDAPIRELPERALESRIRWLGRREQARYRADPFGVPGRPDALYCEVYDYRTGLGSLEALELAGGERIVRATPVPLAPAGHASYPCLFEHEGRLYAVPETADQRRTDLYEIQAGGAWRRVATLLNGVAAADATLFAWEGRFWLAYTDLALGAFDNLCLCYAERLTGPWRRHALHPVKLDHRSSRPAGTPFVDRGTLYRPAQDCGSGYGQATAINRVLRCTPELYREEVARVCRPDPRGPNPHGLHTLSAWGERTLVDGKRYVLNRHELARKLGRRFGRRAEPRPAAS